MWMRQNLIQILRQAQKLDRVEEIYRDMLATTRDDAYRQVLVEYANHLSQTKRAPESEAMLEEYLASHTGLTPQQGASIQYALSAAARAGGDSKRADEIQQKVNAMLPNGPPGPPGPPATYIAPILNKAQSAAWAGNVEEALSLAMEALDKSATAADREQIAWQMPNVASALAQKKAAGASRQLLDRMLALVESWSVDNQMPLLNTLQNYARALFSQRDRWSEVPQVLERYRTAQIAAHGAESGAARDVLQLTLEFQRLTNSRAAAVRSADELLNLEASLSGTTSEPYLSALRSAGDTQEQSGNLEAALSAYARRVEIADTAFSPEDEIRCYVRTDAAALLERHGKFDEAEQLVDQAIEMSKSLRHPSTAFFVQQRENLRRMRANYRPPQ